MNKCFEVKNISNSQPPYNIAIMRLISKLHINCFTKYSW